MVRVPHAAYRKYVSRRRRFMAHDERNEAQVGDVVRITGCRPLSRKKAWRVVQLVQKAV
jgi:small subunit ribosomal protein S17